MESEISSTTTCTSSTSILLLGDGDFSFSLDLANFLVAAINQEHNSETQGYPDNDYRPNDPGKLWEASVQMIVTGIDSAEALRQKYKDSEFLINKLQSLHNITSNTKQRKLQISIEHGVNAILPFGGTVNNTALANFKPVPATYVVFNHPHLGVENAVLHSQFLSHLFHSVVNGWMQNGGSFFLTLASGQWERWEGSAAANRCGLDLLDRSAFTPPETKPHKAYYQQRRHQTGKSFVGRTEGGSEIFTFGCKGGLFGSSTTGNSAAGICNRPFWISPEHVAKDGMNKVERPAYFECDFCDKTFKEERSLKNHLLCKHNEGKQKRKRESFCCQQCSRTFESTDGLMDHIQAKHLGIHSRVKPDWIRDQNVQESTIKTANIESEPSKCEICGVLFQCSEQRMKHSTAFVPIEDVTISSTYQCSFCDKGFREKRARLQHENFCSSRKSEDLITEA